ncbi:MAG TPA: diacylglycerol kinase family protein, partial [Acidimicrobiales bacterium]|nr:diacylglycerol kinase family protein [Acidimicrobiales bacterium]
LDRGDLLVPADQHPAHELLHGEGHHGTGGRCQTPGVGSAVGRVVVVVNPQAGRRRVRSAVPVLERRLRSSGLELDVVTTAGPGDATRLARQAAEEGRHMVVAVGGDGTVHEVVNGLLAARPAGSERPVLGVVSAGSGCDFVRTFGIPGQAERAADRLAGETVRPVDVARLTYVDGRGEPAVRYCANIAEVGLGAATARRAAGLPPVLGPSRYFFAFWATLPGYRPGPVRIEVDGAVTYEGRAGNVVLANCRYFGGGMHISPRSDPADGVLELLAFTGPKTDSFTMLPRIYRGRHVPHPRIVEAAGRRFRLESEQPFPVEADGEVLGTSPLTVEVVPGALDLKT